MSPPPPPPPPPRTVSTGDSIRARFASPKVFRAFYAGGHYSLGGGQYSLVKNVRGDSIHGGTVFTPTQAQALFIVYNDESVHDSLALPNSPVVQRGTVAASSAAFQQYVYDVILTTGVEESANCLRDMSTAGRGTYSPFVVHRLQQDQYRNVLDKLLHHFVLAGTPVSTWSQAVPAPLGKLFKVTGGTGLGAAYISQELMYAGVFRND